jgi:hypothetical protein
MKDVVTCDKSEGAGKQAMISEFPNGATHPACGIPNPECIGVVERTWRTETSQYPEERKATATPSVAASERG